MLECRRYSTNGDNSLIHTAFLLYFFRFYATNMKVLRTKIALTKSKILTNLNCKDLKDTIQKELTS